MCVSINFDKKREKTTVDISTHKNNDITLSKYFESIIEINREGIVSPAKMVISSSSMFSENTPLLKKQ